jgi:tetratricopeptide (TPR) repeat protein
LVKRTRDAAKRREYEDAIAAVYFEGGEFRQAAPLYEKFLAEARKAYAGARTAENWNRLLLMMRRLAESNEMGNTPAKAVPLWDEFSRMVFRPEVPAEWLEARFHLANAYANMNRFNDANDVLYRVEVLYGPDAIGSADKALLARVEALKKKTNYAAFVAMKKPKAN